MKLRDLIAVPFLFLALIFNAIAVWIGGRWAAELYTGKKKDVL